MTRQFKDEDGGIQPPPPNPTPYPPYDGGGSNLGNSNNIYGATDNIVGRVLHYINNPWKFLVVVILSILSWGMFVSYQNIDFVRKIVEKRFSEPHINMSNLDDTLTLLMKNTNADALILYSIDASLNKRQVVRAYDRNGRDKNIDNTEIGLYSSNKTNNEIISRIMSNEVVCLKQTSPTNFLSIWFFEKEATYNCIVSLPPDTFSFVGQLTLAFKDEPENLQQVKDLLVITATSIMRQD